MAISHQHELELRYIEARREFRVRLRETHMSVQRGWHEGAVGRRRSRLPWRAALWPAVLAALAACSGGGSVNIANSQNADPATVDYPIFYVKHTVPTNPNGTLLQDDLRIMQEVLPSADLYMRASASPSAAETNVTARITAGASWDVKDVDTSADGTRVIFAMRGPLTQNQDPKNPPSWRIYQYTIATDTLAPVINPADDPDPPTVDDVSPHYLPDGRIVFSTTRQDQSQGVLLDQGDPQFSALDEARTEPAFVLEVMNPDGTGIHQISFNQSHDRDATVLANGRVLWSRWDDMPAAGRDQMSLYSSNPDGTDLELYYGVNSHDTGTTDSVIEFVHPHQMQNGNILAIVRQYTDVDDGGNLVIIDGTHYVENTQPLLAYPQDAGPAQTPATPNQVVTLPGPSPGGRFISAYPLQDGTGRILVSWGQCRLLDTQQTPPTIVPCTSAALDAPNPQVALPLYSVWMFDPSSNTMLPLMQPVEGVMITDVAVGQPRPLPNIIPDQVAGVTLNQNWFNAGVGVIDIRSVYDFDGVDTANPNIATLANPALTPASARPARFVRLEKAVAIPDPSLLNLSAAAFGASDYMTEILGYAPIEPDGSVEIQVPAQVAFRISVLDANARRITPVQGVWLQVQPGETVACNGCHLPQAGAAHPLSHGRQGLFHSAWAGAAAAGVAFPNTLTSAITTTAGTTLNPYFPTAAGQTMAEARMGWSCTFDSPPCAQMVPSVDVIYTDVWTNPAVATPNPPIYYRYEDTTEFYTPFPTSALCITQWASNCRIEINYPEHIQPLWDYQRLVTNPTTGAVIANNTCTQAGCHNPLNAAGAAQTPAGNLDLTSSASANEPQELTSYQQLLFPHNTVIMGTTGPTPGPSVGPYLNAGSANAALSAAFLGRFAAGSGSTHATYLSPAELRLLSEWLDIGAQYFNNPWDPAVPVN
jgi:Hydrazine synthase alpha subunit middle domain